jgi:hypothetical protein
MFGIIAITRIFKSIIKHILGRPRSQPMSTLVEGAGKPKDPRLGIGVPEGIRRPERFIVIEPETTFTGTIVAIKKEDDGDKHHRLLLDEEFNHFINEKNTAMQHGCLVFEIEPWQYGLTSSALDADKVNGRPVSTYPTVFAIGQRVRITSPILLDTEHNWNESHAPRNVETLPPSTMPKLLNFAEFRYGDGKDQVVE